MSLWKTKISNYHKFFNNYIKLVSPPGQCFIFVGIFEIFEYFRAFSRSLLKKVLFQDLSGCLKNLRNNYTFVVLTYFSSITENPYCEK